MSTNPNNAVGTNAAYDGRTSVKAFNDGIGAYSRGILSGWACSPNTGMTVSLGGDGTTRDIAIAEDVAGNKITVNNISESPISVTMSAAPSTNSRIDSIVAYVDNPPQGAATSIDNPGACGLIAVDGTAAADPVAPDDNAIRTAITADGASGSTAYYVVLATITIATGTTDITAGDITGGGAGAITQNNLRLQTSTCNLTFMHGSTQTGTATATLIPLDSNGLTMLAYHGSTGYNDSGTGARQMDIIISNGLTSVISGALNASYTGDVNAYMTYSNISPSYCGFWMNKTAEVAELLSVSLIIVGYMS